MRLIEADELNERFESSCTTECACCPYSDDNCGLVHEADTVNAIPIPENATNGDMIKALFPNVRIDERLEENLSTELNIIIVKGIDGGTSPFYRNWWNAPYKREVEENADA